MRSIVTIRVLGAHEIALLNKDEDFSLIVYAYIQMISVHRSIVYIHVSSVRRLVASIQVSSVCQSIFYIQVNSVHRLVASIQVSSACSQIGCFNLGVNWVFFFKT